MGVILLLAHLYTGVPLTQIHTTFSIALNRHDVTEQTRLQVKETSQEIKDLARLDNTHGVSNMTVLLFISLNVTTFVRAKQNYPWSQLELPPVLLLEQLC